MSLSLKEWCLIIATSGTTTLNSFLSGSLTAALPTIGRDLSFKQADLQWPLNVYALSYGCLLILFGRVGDIIGSRKMFLYGSIWFGIWSLASAFAPTDTAFIIFMALKGLGAAANSPSAVSILSKSFEAGPKKNKAFGALGAGQPVGFILGLVVGGILTDSKATWRSIFYIQAGLAFGLIGLAAMVLPPDTPSNRYSKGLDWFGAILSTTGLALLTYSVSDSATAPQGWGTPRVPAMLVASIALLGMFIFWEHRREAKGRSVLMPLSMWTQPGARMSSVIPLVFFAWWSFNTIGYFATLYYQQALLLSPLQTSIRFIPMAIAGFIVNVVTGYAMGKFSGQTLMLIGLVGSITAPIIFALIDVHSSYWAMAFLVMVFVVGADVVYPIGNLQVCSAFGADSQSLAGAIFTVTTRLGTSLGLAVTTSVSTSVSRTYNSQNPLLISTSPAVLMKGFRAAGWVCCAAALLSFTIGAVGLRDIGVVGRVSADEDVGIEKDQTRAEESGDIELYARDISQHD